MEQPVLAYKPRTVIGGLKRKLNLRENEEQRLIPQLYTQWERRRGELADAVPGRTFGVEIYPEKPDFNPHVDHFHYLAGAEITGEHELPEGMEAFVAEAGTYAVFTYRGKMDGIGAFISEVYQEWFPRSAYRPGCYDLEVYDERFRGPDDERSVMEFWVPVIYTKPHHCGIYESTWTTAAQAVREAIKFTGKKDVSLVDVMGYTGHAFRINIRDGDVHVSGPTAWHWGPVLTEGLLNLGIRASYLGELNFTPPTPEQLGDAIAKVQRSIDRGVPAVAWDLFIPEFGVIFGYDDEKQEFHAKDVSKEGTLPYHKLGRGEIGELFVLTVDEWFEVDKRTALAGALQIIIDHAHIQDRTFPEYRNGLAGFDAWIGAFRKGAVDVFGNAYNTAVVCDARAYAVKFLEQIEQQWNGPEPEQREVSRLAGEAAAHYRTVYEALAELPPLYPFPQGGNPDIAANAEYSIAVLERAKAAEERGVAVLERMRDALGG